MSLTELDHHLTQVGCTRFGYVRCKTLNIYSVYSDHLVLFIRKYIQYLIDCNAETIKLTSLFVYKCGGENLIVSSV